MKENFSGQPFESVAERFLAVERAFCRFLANYFFAMGTAITGML
jgi:hypothetical protein